MASKVIRYLYNTSQKHQGAVVTIGNFDGVHVGHQQLIGKTVEKARALGVPSIAITFEPHTHEYFATKRVARLTRFREKVTALLNCGIDYVLILKFNQALANLSASDFLTTLFDAIHPRLVLVGDDFRFGKNRQGDINTLKEMGDKLGFSVESLAPILLDEERVSSTRVRQALAKGDHRLANRLLGHSYTMMGRVRGGDRRGREWGFPTANIFLHRQLTPVHGVYTVLLHGIVDKPLPGVANIGTRPTVDGTRTLLEVHLLDFNQDIYGCYVIVEFCEKLRDEIRFPNLEMLKEAIANDVMMARNYFKDGVL